MYHACIVCVCDVSIVCEYVSCWYSLCIILVHCVSCIMLVQRANVYCVGTEYADMYSANIVCVCL